MSQNRSGYAAQPVATALATELAHDAIAVLSPDELELFEIMAQDYYDDPERALSADTTDEKVGFGLDLAVMTPYAIAVATAAVHTLGTILSDALKAEGTPVLKTYLHRVMNRRKGRGQVPETTDASADGRSPAPEGNVPSPTAPTLTAEQAKQIRLTAWTKARALGLSKQRAGLLADAITGALATS